MRGPQSRQIGQFQSAVRIAVSLKVAVHVSKRVEAMFQSAVRIAVSLKPVDPPREKPMHKGVSIRRADRCLAEADVRCRTRRRPMMFQSAVRIAVSLKRTR